MNKISFLRKCIDVFSLLLINNKANSTTERIRDLIKIEDYHILLTNVANYMLSYPEASEDDIRHIVYNCSGVSKQIDNMVYKKRLVPGMVIGLKAGNYEQIIMKGNKNETTLVDGVIKEKYDSIERNTLYDMGSTSKLFTLLAIYSLYDNGLIDLDKPIYEYDKRFVNLNQVTVNDILKYKVNIIATEKINKIQSSQQAEKIIFNSIVSIVDNSKLSYSDIDAMVLKYVVESIAKCTLDYYLNTVIFNTSNMASTTLNVSEGNLSRIAHNNFSSVVDTNGTIITDFKATPGVVYDAKARMLSNGFKNASGHAGYFTSVSDMMKLNDKIINKEIISGESLNSLTYMNRNLSIVPQILSDNTIMNTSYTGVINLIDPLNNISIFNASNRLQNRIHRVAPEINIENDCGLLKYKNHIASLNYAHEVKILNDLLAKLAVQYRFLAYVNEKKLDIKIYNKTR